MVEAMDEDRHTGRARSPECDDGEVAGAPVPDEPAPPDAGNGTARCSPPEPAASGHRRLAAWWSQASPNMRGSVYMISALLVYAVMVGGIKHVGEAIPLVQILLIRQIIMSALILALTPASIGTVMRTARPGLQVFRSVVTMVAMLCGFTAVVKIPLAQATAIGFSQVLFVTIAAVIFLKEIVDGRRWTATIIGFVGVLVMLRPTTDGLDLYALMAVAGALLNAAITISVRLLAATERTDTILIYQAIVMIVSLALPTWLWWVPPNAEQWFWLVTLSVFGTAGQWLITRAYQVGEAAALAPIDFSRLILASFTGYIFFAEIPRLTTWIGAVIVIGATLYTIRRNGRGLHASGASA